MSAVVSIGLPGATSHEIVRALAPRIERLGFHALWLNDTPQPLGRQAAAPLAGTGGRGPTGGDSLEGLRVAAAETTTLALGTGVIPLDRRPASSLDLGGLPIDRLTLGIGSGGQEGAVARVLDAIDELSEATDARIVVGALGPRMRRLAAEQTDGVLLNWLTPSTAEDAMADLHRDAHGREVVGSLYVRTIADAGALPTLEAEAGRYESYPAYAANFERLGIRGIDATIQNEGDLAAYLPIVDEVVLRAITPDGTLRQLETFVDTTAGWLHA